MPPSPPLSDLPEIEPWTADDELLESTREDGRPRLRFHVPEHPHIVVGRGAKPALEVHLERARADGIPVRRRPGGGGAVVLDPGNLVVSLALPTTGPGDLDRRVSRIMGWFLEGLSNAGISGLQRRGFSDITLGDWKVSGSGMFQPRKTLYFSATLLVDADLRLMDRYLLHPPKEPDYRQGRPHREFVTNLAKHYPGLTVEILQERLAEYLEAEKAIRSSP